jgi:hypothetical protein
MALCVSNSSGKGDFPAEAQCTQLLLQAKVDRQGKMYKGPLLVNELNSIEPWENGYLTLHAETTKNSYQQIYQNL